MATGFIHRMRFLGAGGKNHNIFQYDNRINYSLHFGHSPVFYKLLSLEVVEDDWKERFEEAVALIEGAMRIRDCWGVGPGSHDAEHRGEYDDLVKMESGFKSFLSKNK